MIARVCWIVCGIAVLPAIAEAQVINGAVEWAVVRGGQTSGDGSDSANDSFWQRYTVGLTTPVFDPRLLKCNAQASFRTTSLSTGPVSAVQEGRQRDISYNLGASIFPSRPFPFVIEAVRDTVGESGDYPASSGIRGGIPLPPGTPSPDSQTHNTSLNLGWQMNAAGLPRLDFGYRARRSQVSAGPFGAEQSDGDLHAGIYLDTDRTRQSLRFQRTSFENAVSQVFDQRISDLDYDVGVRLGLRSRARVRAGRRGTFSRFDVPAPIVDPGVGSYSPPPRGDVMTNYLLGGVTYEPSRRVAIDVAGNVDRQNSETIVTTARLATSTMRVDLAPGLSINASGTYGNRGQVIGTAPVQVRTQAGQAGATYRVGARGIEVSAGGTRGIGTSTTPAGESGRLRSWSAQGGLSVSTPWVGLSAGYDRASSDDAILVFGNYRSARTFGAAQKDVGRLSLAATFENAIVQRGRDLQLASNHQQVFTTSASYRRQDQSLSANGGGFKNVSEVGRDVTWFYGASYQGQLHRALRTRAWVRRERTTATQTRLDQHTIASFAEIEYRFRQFRVGAEYRRNDQQLLYERLVDPYMFRGHQLQLRVTRIIGIAL
jgi:hypothetical protein